MKREMMRVMVATQTEFTGSCLVVHMDGWLRIVSVDDDDDGGQTTRHHHVLLLLLDLAASE